MSHNTTGAGKPWKASELRKLSPEQRDAIMQGAAIQAEEDYRKDWELTAFEAFGKDDLPGDSASTHIRKSWLTFLMSGLVLALIAVVLFGLLVPVLFPQGYFLYSRNLEMVFVVTDAETGEPIPNTSIDLMTEEYREQDPGDQGIKLVTVIKLVTDTEGKATFLHKNNMCEDVCKPFRKTVTLIDLHWAYVNVSAKGYVPVKQVWLGTAKYEDKGYISEAHCQRVEFNVPLHKRDDK